MEGRAVVAQSWGGQFTAAVRPSQARLAFEFEAVTDADRATLEAIKYDTGYERQGYVDRLEAEFAQGKQLPNREFRYLIQSDDRQCQGGHQ